MVSLFSSELKNYGNAMRLLNFEMRKFLGGSNSDEICLIWYECMIFKNIKAIDLNTLLVESIILCLIKKIYPLQ